MSPFEQCFNATPCNQTAYESKWVVKLQ